MKKTLLRIALAAGLVGAVNWAMNSDNKALASEIKAQQEQYRISDPDHLDYVGPNAPFDLSESEAQDACDDGTANLCATGDEGTTIRWSGVANKF